MTYLEVKYDLSKPVYVNNRVPISFGLTAKTAAEPALIAVTFNFIEANPVDPEEPVECASSALVVEFIPDGKEQRFDGFIWPTTLCAGLVGRDVNLSVEFDGGAEIDNGFDSPSVSFREEDRDHPINQACRTNAGVAGCVYGVDIQLTPTEASESLIDVRHAAMSTASSVALLPAKENAPSLSIESVLVVNGRDPYISAMNADEVPDDLIADEPGIADDLRFGLTPEQAEDLIAMPGVATMRYEIRPSGSTDAFRALRSSVTDAPNSERVDAAPIERLLPGSPNTFVYELFADGETRKALNDEGEWGDVTDFEVRGCFEADFLQAGNEGVQAPDDCQVLEVVLVREVQSASAATSFQLNERLGRRVGGSRLGLDAGLETENSLDTNGVSSRIEGNVTIEGKLGRKFAIDIARARAAASAGADPAANGYEVAVIAFNQTLFEISETGGEITREQEFSIAKSFAFGNLGFGFGPVRIGIELSLGGDVGIGIEDALSTTTDAATCTDNLEGGAFLVCGQIGRTTTPFFAFTADVVGGVRIGPVSGGVEANLRLINTEFPLEATLHFGVDGDGLVSVLGRATWNLDLRLIVGDVSIVGRIKFRRRFLRRFNRTLRVHLFSFSSPLIQRTLLERVVPIEVLR